MGGKQVDYRLCLDLEDLNLKEQSTLNHSLQELLTDDESENEAKELNKQFRSKCSAPNRRNLSCDDETCSSLSMDERLQVTDSDEMLYFDCVPKEVAGSHAKGAVQTNFSESLFSQNDALVSDLSQLSAKISCLALLSPVRKARKSDVNDEGFQDSLSSSKVLTNAINAITISSTEGPHAVVSNDTTVSGEITFDTISSERNHPTIPNDTTVSGEITCDTNLSERAHAMIPNDTTVSGEIPCGFNASESFGQSFSSENYCSRDLSSRKSLGNDSTSGKTRYKPDDSVVTISSTASTPSKSCISSLVSDNHEIIVLSDSENDAYSANVSSVRESGQTNLGTTLSNTAADRIEAFLKDTFTKGVSSAENSVNRSNLDESLPDESVEIAGTSSEEEIVDDAEKTKIEDNDFPKKKEDIESSISCSQHSIQSCIEKINISATIKIKVQISEPVVIHSDESESNCTDDSGHPNEYSNGAAKCNTRKDEKIIITTNSSSCVNEVNEKLELPPRTETRKPESTPTRKRIGKGTIKTPNLEKSIDLDDKAKKVLDQLYGSSWQTPEIIRTLDKMDKTEETLNFTDFHQNINKDLESTSLEALGNISPKLVQIKNDFKKPLITRRNKKESEAVKTIKTPRVIKTKAGRNAVQKLPMVPDMFSNEEEDLPKDDSSLNVSSSSGSDSSFEKYKVNKKKREKKAKDDLVYLDLSADLVRVQEVYESPAANNDNAFNERLQDILRSCKYEDKPKFEITPSKNNIKRKLFTPRFGEENEDEIPAPLIPAEDISALNDTDYVKMRVPLPAIFTPVNKQLEAVKLGIPIFKAKNSPGDLKKPPGSSGKKTDSTTKKKGAPIGEITKENSPQVSDKRKINFRTFEKEDTPRNKYGFLKSLDVMVSKSLCHPDALYYRENFKARKDELVQRLFELYNEKLFNNELTVPIEWNKKLLNTAGRCRNKKMSNGQRSSTIELSEKVLTSADRLRCTLIHELCHAATWIFNGENGHGATWKLWAKKANVIFPELPKIGVCHQYDIEYKYTYKCTLCGAKSHAHSKSKKVENIRCSFCHGAIEIFLNKKDKDGNVIPTPVKEPSGFAKFVKEKYKIHKKLTLKHADVMKILSNEFAALSVSEKSKY